MARRVFGAGTVIPPSDPYQSQNDYLDYLNKFYAVQRQKQALAGPSWTDMIPEIGKGISGFGNFLLNVNTANRQDELAQAGMENQRAQRMETQQKIDQAERAFQEKTAQAANLRGAKSGFLQDYASASEGPPQQDFTTEASGLDATLPPTRIQADPLAVLKSWALKNKDNPALVDALTGDANLPNLLKALGGPAKAAPADKLMNVGAGATVFDPETRQPVYTAPKDKTESQTPIIEGDYRNAVIRGLVKAGTPEPQIRAMLASGNVPSTILKDAQTEIDSEKEKVAGLTAGAGERSRIQADLNKPLTGSYVYQEGGQKVAGRVFQSASGEVIDATGKPVVQISKTDEPVFGQLGQIVAPMRAINNAIERGVLPQATGSAPTDTFSAMKNLAVGLGSQRSDADIAAFQAAQQNILFPLIRMEGGASRQAIQELNMRMKANPQLMDTDLSASAKAEQVAEIIESRLESTGVKPPVNLQAELDRAHANFSRVLGRMGQKESGGGLGSFFGFGKKSGGSGSAPPPGFKPAE